MVDMDVVMQRVARGLYTGVGAVVTGGIGNFIGDQVDNNKAVAAGEIALGLGVSVGVDEVFSNPDSVPNDAIEHVGYGMQAVGWDELAEDLNLHPVGQTGAEVINVRSHANDDREQTGANGTARASQNQNQTRRAGEYKMDTA